MRLYQSGALLTGARNELIRRGGVLVDGPRIVAAGPLDILMAEYPLPADVVDLGDVTLLPGLVDAHVHLGFDGGPGPVARMRAETDTEQLILMLRSARELLSVGVTTARDPGARKRVAAHGRLGITQAVAAQVDTIEHGSFAGPDRKYGSDFDPAVVDEIAAAGIYVCPALNGHALTLRERLGGALER
jgi:predicted amidohydrolase YtcJ